MRRTRLAALWFGALLLMSGPAAAHDRFDGLWSLYIFGDAGVCDFGYRVPVKIDSRLVSYNGRTFSPSVVTIGDSGSVAIRLESASYVVTGSGALSSGRGSGRWAAPTFHCTGRWRAERQ
jgi:hypothetical protein